MSDDSSCEDIVRKVDYDRYLSALFVPERKRAHILALYAFNYEIAKIADTVHEPVMGQMRLQWWRDAIEEVYAGHVRRHEVATALFDAVQAADLPRAPFDALIDARESDLIPVPFSDLSAMQEYAGATSGTLMRLALRILGAGEGYDRHADHLGIAYALTGLLRALPHFAARRRLMLPRDELLAAGLSEEDVFSGNAPGLRILTDHIVGVARARMRLSHISSVPRRFLPALLPAALVAPYLRLMMVRDFDPFRDSVALSTPRRQLAMLGAMMRGRI
jgi:phytoene synthase